MKCWRHGWDHTTSSFSLLQNLLFLLEAITLDLWGHNINHILVWRFVPFWAHIHAHPTHWYLYGVYPFFLILGNPPEVITPFSSPLCCSLNSRRLWGTGNRAQLLCPESKVKALDFTPVQDSGFQFRGIMVPEWDPRPSSLIASYGLGKQILFLDSTDQFSITTFFFLLKKE